MTAEGSAAVRNAAPGTRPPVYFLSYARDDREDSPDLLPRFLADLDATLRQRLGVDRDDAPGFFDAERIETGTAWSTRLADALRTANVFVPILSPRYFGSHYCGREWTAFTARLPGVSKDPTEPGVIQPVLLVPPTDLNPMPAAVSGIQNRHESYPAAYQERGLAYVMRTLGGRDDYQQFVWAFSDKIVRAVKNTTLPVPDSTPPLRETPSAFHDPATGVQIVESSHAPGRRPFAQVLYVAATAAELAELRREITAYGDAPSDWRPFLPVLDDEVDRIVNAVTYRENFRYEPVTMPAGDLVERIRDAIDNQNKVVVVVVDAWTVRLEHYRNRMQRLDEANLPSCVVIVPVNTADAETAACVDDLRATLDATFANRYATGDDVTFATWVETPEQLESTLARALAAAKSRNLRRRAALARRVPGAVRLPTINGAGQP